ncbi:Uncharacterized protein Rs2_28092 [Raphanus sativus]|nr:Uncharacterized protein Rs2_28092 [Raphanus sativus]
MFTLASEVGKVKEIAYDPKVSQTKDYIRALITFDVDKPAKATRQLNVPGGEAVTIGFVFEKIHKCCFHCLRLTHGKIRCPYLKRGFNKDKQQEPENQMVVRTSQDHESPSTSTEPKGRQLEGPPGFPHPPSSLNSQKRNMRWLCSISLTPTKQRGEPESRELKKG